MTLEDKIKNGKYADANLVPEDEKIAEEAEAKLEKLIKENK